MRKVYKDMQEGRYLLSIEALQNKAKVLSKEEWNTYLGTLVERLDEERRAKVQALKFPQKQAESLGAGLLLQYAVQRALGNNAVLSGSLCEKKVVQQEQEEKLQYSLQGREEGFIMHITLSQLLEVVTQPIPLSYVYNEQGKPYLKDIPLYFNLSHSGKYIFCAVSEQEIGVDIQSMEGKVSERIVRRFFAAEEQSYWENCDTEEERKRVFYRLWCRKEAYGKLTGEGVVGELGRNLMWNVENDTGNDVESPENTGRSETLFEREKEENKLQLLQWEEYNLANQYQIAVCKWK